MNMPGFVSAAYTTTVNVASNVFEFTKDLFGRGITGCSSLANKVNQVVQKFLPEVISNAVKAHPMKFACAGSALVSGVAVVVISRAFFRGPTPKEDSNIS